MQIVRRGKPAVNEINKKEYDHYVSSDESELLPFYTAVLDDFWQQQRNKNNKIIIHPHRQKIKRNKKLQDKRKQQEIS